MKARLYLSVLIFTLACGTVVPVQSIDKETGQSITVDVMADL